MEINFFTEDIESPELNKSIITEWLSSIVKDHKYEIQDLNYIFCSDDYLHKINVEYLDHDDLTDIITFDNSETPNTIEADIFISIERVKENASNFKVSFHDELHRVLVHGLLHLLGFGDKTNDQKDIMRKNEDACLSLLSNLDK